MANLVYKRVSTDQQSTARQNLVLIKAGIEDPVVFEESAGTSSRLHPVQRPKFGELLTYARPGDTVHISEVFRLVRGTQHILDVLDVLHTGRLALRIHDGAFSAMDLTARHPRTGELLSTVKFMVQTLAAAGELQRDLQRELTYDGLRAAEAKGSKGGRRPAIPAAKTDTVRTAYLEGRSIAALAREHGVSRGAVRTAVADLMPERTATGHEDTPAPELPVTLDMPGKIADFLRTAELEPDERAALDHGVTVRRGQGYTLRVSTTPAVHRQLLARCQPPRRHPGHHGGPGPAQGPPRVREPSQHPRADRTMIVLSANGCTDVPRGRKPPGACPCSSSLPTMLVAFARYSRDGSFKVLAANLRFTAIMAAGSIAGAVLGGLLLGVIPDRVLIPGLAVILLISAIKMARHAAPKPA